MAKYCLLFAAALLSFAMTPVPKSLEVSELVEHIRSRKHNAGLAVAVFQADRTLHMSLHGHADVETQRPVAADTLFMIGSTTKAMTATAAGYLVQQGELSWETSVRDLVPSFELMDSEATMHATLRDLLLHRTGLPRHDFAWLSRTWSSSEYLDLLPLLEPSVSFRGKWQYQNLMYMVAGLMAGNAAESSWAEVVSERIFRNLDMNHTRALERLLREEDDVATPHAWNGTQIVKIPARDIDGMGPAGSVYSSIEDMVKWVQFNLRNGEAPNGTSLASEVMAEIHRPQIDMGTVLPFPEFVGNLHYGLGWAVGSYRNNTIIQHNGGIDGFLTNVVFLPERDLGIVVLTNGGDLSPDVVSLSVLDHFLGADPVDWVERFDSLQSEEPFPEVDFPESYEGAEGVFSHPAYGTFSVSEVELEGTKLLNLDLNGGFSFTLNPWLTENSALWQYNHRGFVFNFHFGEDGHVSLIEANLEPTVPLLQFTRVAGNTAPQGTLRRPPIRAFSPLNFDSF